jgi:hypothetical protein
MSQRILKASSICAVIAALTSGCGSTAVTTSQSHTNSGMALARHVLKVSESQNITEVQQTVAGAPRSSLLVTVRNLQIRESVAPDGTPTMVQIGKHAYMRSAYQLHVIKGHPDVRADKECYAAIGTVWPTLSVDVLPAGAEIYRVSGNTAYFKSSTAKGTKASETTKQSDVARVPGDGYFRFNSDDLATYEVIKSTPTPTLKVRTTLAFSYPKTAPATLVTKLPKNICR